MSSTDKIRKKRTEFLLGFPRYRKRCRILDIGCQSGYTCHRLSEIGHEPYGVEVLDESVTKARDKYPGIDFRVGNCEEQIPFDNRFFDVVWAGDVIKHIRFTDVFVNEVNRVLKIGGLFILTTPMHNRLKNLIIALYNFERHFDPEFPHLRFYTLKSLRTVLKKRGFFVKKVKYLGRIAPLAKSMCVVAEKRRDEEFFSKYHF